MNNRLILKCFALTGLALFAVSSTHADYKHSGGCGSVCFGTCEDYSNRKMPVVKCVGADPASPMICKMFVGECARLEDGQCGWKPNAEFVACLRTPKAYAKKYNTLPDSRAKNGGVTPSGGCSEQNAIAAVQSDPIVANFCVQKVNELRHGCNFKARPPSPLNVNEKNDSRLAWIIIASLIHSFDKKGQPQFAPEGAAVIKVSKACAVTERLGPSALPLK
jgi:hypothetical protein